MEEGKHTQLAEGKGTGRRQELARRTNGKPDRERIERASGQSAARAAECREITVTIRETCGDFEGMRHLSKNVSGLMRKEVCDANLDGDAPHMKRRHTHSAVPKGFGRG